MSRAEEMVETALTRAKDHLVHMAIREQERYGGSTELDEAIADLRRAESLQRVISKLSLIEEKVAEHTGPDSTATASLRVILAQIMDELEVLA